MINLDNMRLLVISLVVGYFCAALGSATGQIVETKPPEETTTPPNVAARRALLLGFETMPPGEGPPLVIGGAEPGPGIFSRLPLHVSTTISEGYDDNVNTAATNELTSLFTNGSLDVTYVFGSPRTQLSLAMGAGGTYYYERIGTQNYDVDFHLGLNLRHRATPRVTVSSNIYVAYLTEPNFGFGATLRRSGNYFYTADRFSVSYLSTPRFSTLTSYTVNVFKYDDASVGIFTDRLENTFGNEFRFLLLPTTALVAEYRYELVNYEHEGEVLTPALFFDGFKIIRATRLERDSTTQFLLGGVDHNFSPRLNGSLRAGMEFRDYVATGQKTEPYGEATISYAAGKRTSLSWTNRYGIEEPAVPGTPSRTTYRTGLQARQQVTPRVVATLAFYYEHDTNQGVTTASITTPPFSEDSFDLSLSVRYAITHYLGVEVGYNRTDILSDISLREYTRNRIHGGLNFAF